MTTPYINVVAVKQVNLDAAWGKDIVVRYKSQTPRMAILDGEVPREREPWVACRTALA
jgi:ABC-type metal ion transport system substrate-binding protein